MNRSNRSQSKAVHSQANLVIQYTATIALAMVAAILIAWSAG